eukprot:2592005-Amphidinium_carterae.1
MDRADTAATLTSGDVGLATALTLVKDPGWPFLVVVNRFLKLNLWPLTGVSSLSTPLPGAWTVTGKR